MVRMSGGSAFQSVGVEQLKALSGRHGSQAGGQKKLSEEEGYEGL